MSKYIAANVEKKWIADWQEKKLYKTNKSASKSGTGKKMYILDMFPYPSGAGLHVGHPRGYTSTDILSRYYRMKGYQVLHPMGWDAFGLPAENAAVKARKNPMDMVPNHIETFKRQMIDLGFSYDWDRELATIDPDYYATTQWLFSQFYKLGLLYKKQTSVYFCPTCKTGLAEEEVLPNGTHERCNNPITRKQLPQWIFRITTYADSLLDGLKELKWPPGILEMQKNWIGKDKGLNINFKVVNTEEEITVWTKFWETLYGATFLVIAPEHPWVRKIIKKKDTPAQVGLYVEEALAKTDEQRLKEEKEKTGVFTGYYGLNPANQKKVPIWVADYVLSNVGTGAVMGVPSHDERDFLFAKKYNLPLQQVVTYKDSSIDGKVAKGEISYEGEGTLINSGNFNGMFSWGEDKKRMAEWMIQKKFADWQITYHLRDWIFSRQRYWGEPIPMIFCKACFDKKISWWDTKESDSFKKTYRSILKVDQSVKENVYGWFPLDEKDLPLELPLVKSYEPTDTGESPLAKVKEWVDSACPNCGAPGRRETDTMPNWAGSCWYFLAFTYWTRGELNPKLLTEKEAVSAVTQWMPVDWYVGGAEHAVLHLLYARFWMHILHDMKLVSYREPFIRLKNVGMILAEDHRKMSKSLGNVINPDEIVAEYGADTLRVYEMFMAPFSQEIAWSTTALQGAYRFINRIWKIYEKLEARSSKQEEDEQLVSRLQKTIKKVAEDIEEFKFNTAIAALMEFLNSWESSKEGLNKESGIKLLKLLAPFSPFIAEEIWSSVFSEKNSIHQSSWPTVDAKAIMDEVIQIPVQVNGKVRGVIAVGKNETDQDTVVKKALDEEKVSKYIKDKTYKIIYVPKKILNFII